MACKKCGSKFKALPNVDRPIYTVQVTEDEVVRIGAKSSILIEGLTFDETFLAVGKVIKIGRAAAADLLKQGAPIWILP